MRIGLVLDESLDPEDGVQQYVMRVGSWMATHGHEVYYLVGETHTRQLSNLYSLSKNVKVSFNGNRLSIPLPTSQKKLRHVLDELNLDVLHVQTPFSPFMAGRLMRLARPSTAVVGTFHILPYGFLARIGSCVLGHLTRKTSRRFDSVLAVSEPARVFAQKYFYLHSQVTPNAFDFKRFYRGAPAHEDGATKNIVFLGRLVERKGPRELLRAIEKLHQAQKLPGNWKVHVGGKGPLLDELRSMATQAGLQDVVEFAGFVADDKKVDFLARADIAVFPSLAGESFGISLLEALAAARGVVLAGNNPGYASVMRGFEAQLFAPRDTTSFSRLLLHYIDNPEQRQASAAAQKIYVKKFDIEQVGKTVESVYKKAVEKRRAA